MTHLGPAETPVKRDPECSLIDISGSVAPCETQERGNLRRFT